MESSEGSDHVITETTTVQPCESTISLTEAAKVIGVSVPTVRRAYDKDRGRAGHIIPAGSTGSPERRVNRTWAAEFAAKIAEAKATGTFGRGKRKTRGEQPAGQ